MTLLVTWWREIAIAVLVALLALQTQHVSIVKEKLKVETTLREAREKRDSMRLAQRKQAKRTADEEYKGSRGRAGSVRVRNDSTGIKPGDVRGLPGSNNESTICFERGKLVEELTGWAERDATRLSAILERQRERSTGVARQGEEVAAAYRSCRTFTLNLPKE